ncbi:MAG: hypothetical protein KatS3mg009_1006 [Acidimicrobiia bacterium]|nr:MAG: hypothetical protein KatS3mg009_1006 [Acidimicrobiia bacterium]
MRLHRLRIELDDTPGALGRIATALGAVGVNIVDLEVHSGAAGARVDEMVVDLAGAAGPRTVETAVARSGGRVVELARVDAHELRDRVTASLHLVASLVGGGHTDAEGFAEVARLLVGAELAWVHRPDPGEQADAHEVVSRVRRTRCPAQVEQPVKRLPSGGGPTWWLALPADGDPPEVLVLVRRGPRFTFTETARAQALLALRTAVARRPARVLARLAGGGTVELRTLGPADHAALAGLHARCSEETIRRRYLGPLPKDSHRVLARLCEPRAGDVAVAAVADGTLVGVAHACRDDCGEFEMAFLVEDAHQHRGIGTLLLAEVRTRLAAAGAARAYVLTGPGNTPMCRMMRSAGAGAPAWSDGVLRYDLTVATGSSTNTGITRSVAAW